jgi:hypothetical protein
MMENGSPNSAASLVAGPNRDSSPIIRNAAPQLSTAQEYPLKIMAPNQKRELAKVRPQYRTTLFLPK